MARGDDAGESDGDRAGAGGPDSVTALPREFYRREAAVVARALIGCILVHRTPAATLRARIVETEAYIGSHDAASHSRAGVTARTAPMFGPPGHAYVYLVYGMHSLLNVVTGAEGSGQAVLLRGADPADGRAVRLDGPGRLAKGMGIRLADNDLDLCARDATLAILPGRPPTEVAVSRRVGVDYAGEWRDAELRFYDPEARGVSRVPRAFHHGRGGGDQRR